MALDTGFKAQITDAIDSLIAADKMNMANAIFTDENEIKDFKAKHNIIIGVVNGNKIPIITKGNRYGSLKASKGNCDMNTCDLEANYSNKEWIIGDYDCRVPICLDEYAEDFMRFWGFYKQTLEDPTTEPTVQAFLDWLVEFGKENVNGALWRTGYWGDKSSSNDLIKLNNGIWTEAEAGDGEKIDMGSKTTPMTGEQIYQFLEKAYVASVDKPFFRSGNVIWKMSYKMAATLVAFLNTTNDRSKYNCDCIDVDSIAGVRRFTVDNLVIFGIPVEAFYEVDDSGEFVGKTSDYRALLIDRDNVLIGVNTDKHLNQFDMFWDRKDKKIYIDMKIQIGASIPRDESYTYLFQSA